MIARASQLFLPTLRDDPADAEAASHKLLVRGGFIRQVGAGLWTYMPLGWRVHQKVVQIIREEMDAIGAQEMLAPVLTPAELWQTSGRYDLPVVFKLQDRSGRQFVLPMSHEETFAFHGRELQSYKQLPQAWYHFSTKELKRSVGLAVQWLAPLGLFRFSFGVPLNARHGDPQLHGWGDETEGFQFSVGNAF